MPKHGINIWTQTCANLHRLAAPPCLTFSCKLLTLACQRCESGSLPTAFPYIQSLSTRTELWILLLSPSSDCSPRDTFYFVCIFTSTCFFHSVQSLSRVRLFATPWTAARQASLSITNSRSLLKLMSTEFVMPSNHLILCHPLLLPPSIFPSIRVFSNESVLCICCC